MAGTNNTFKNLQDYEIAPPPGLFAKLWKKIKRTGHPLQSSQTAEIEPKSDLENTGTANFSNLKSYSSHDLQPPAFNFSKIKEAALLNTNETGQPTVKTTKPAPIIFKLLAAATITGVAFLIYFLLYSGNQIDKSKNMSADAGSLYASDKRSQTNSGESNNNQDSISPNNNGKLPHFNLIYANGYISKNGNSTLVENDFIYTFTNFTYDQSISFLKKLKKDKLISLNSYSYLNISEKMAEYLKGMYEVNDKDKPTRKSKKLKAKLAKWKKKDESYFDRSLQKNPLDIIDLGEFILK